MQVISNKGNFSVSSNFGNIISEGSSSAGTAGKIITFSVLQAKAVYTSLYWKIEPTYNSTGSYGDFWDEFFSNKVGGEPAADFSTGGFGLTASIKINPDLYFEADEQFVISFYNSALDRHHGIASVISATFTIANDDGKTIYGSSGADSLVGTAYADTIKGGAGDDVLNGKSGADLLIGGTGNDTYFVDNASDRVIEAVGEGRDTVITTVSYRLVAGQQIEVLQTADANGKAAVTLTGNEITNKLVGNVGNNVLDGGAGIDEMRGGAGNDTYVVDNARDIVVEAAGGGTDTVTASVSYTLKAGQEIESMRLLGSAKLNLTGNEFGQSLTGNASNNVLDGGLGNDVLTGGKGADSFVFATTLGAGNVDRITDFAVEDTMRLSKSVLAALAPGQLSAGEFKDIAKAKVDADDHILYDSRNGSLFYDADGSGKAVAVKFAVLDNKAAITHADFFVV